MNNTDIEKLEAVVSHLASGTAPGIIASVQRGGATLLRRGCGLASLDSGLVNTPSTKMRIGSTTKHFCCALILMLRDEGKLSIDEPVSRWLPELPASQGSRTLRHFMNHTGGMRDYLDLSLLSNGLAIVPADAAYDYQCRQQEQNFAPGEQLIYNNGGYRLLSMVIERVLQMPLGQALRHRLFEPLSMHDTSLWSSDLDPLPGCAATHLAHPDGRFSKSLFPAVILGEGGVASTLDDMQRWLSHLISPVLWPRALSEEMMTPTELRNGYLHPYGFGLIRERWRGLTIFHHAGGVVGGTCQMLAAPEHDIQIVVMSNRSDVAAADIAQKLLSSLIGPGQTEAEQPADPALAEPLGGAYYCPGNGRHFSIEARDGALYLVNFGMPMPLLQDKDDDGLLRVNVLSVIALEVAPVRDGSGAVQAIEIVEQGERYRCDRVAACQDGMAAAFGGKWRSAELGADIVIQAAGPGAASMRIAGLYGRSVYKLQPLRPDVCLMVSADPHLPLHGTLRLQQHEGGRRELILDTARTRRLRLQEDHGHG
ncbi:hypothetical protein ASD15_08995 [Massilia sp. Root351]|uniref:serine hydrolase domain-containing protein n=1 Tax=Massilia sp. Root351 TaxID=1736522 RepID=UPI00070C8A95|nr:serine hydrolase domain-containing protein [Massilia sp. Root351]KQV82193.1 hypothetical protein ASD15_08995 [Massilia sp. Root351]